MKITRLVVLSLIICVMFLFSVNGEETEKKNPLDEALGDALIALVNKDYEKAVKLLEPIADKNARAKGILGRMIYMGTGIEVDTNKGMAMIMDAARQGDEEAKKNAVDLNHQLAKNGDVKAMYNMGHMCLNGWGGEIESGQCLKWLEDAANLGHSNSAKFLAHIYKNGKYGLAADQNKATEWTQKAQQPPQAPQK
ncbi:MAG: sel1 repeat family protein [Deltaproteobacteria bacterium]|nr:sel1 repeat family protein [Deltaproteobacteria bacterium]